MSCLLRWALTAPLDCTALLGHLEHGPRRETCQAYVEAGSGYTASTYAPSVYSRAGRIDARVLPCRPNARYLRTSETTSPRLAGGVANSAAAVLAAQRAQKH